MTMSDWIDFIGTSQDDPEFQAAIAAANVKKIPKLKRDELEVYVQLKGHGLALSLMDEAYLRGLANQDIGEGPLIVRGVYAMIKSRKSNDLYCASLPYKLASQMTRAEAAMVLGKPDASDEDIPADFWTVGNLQLVVGFAKELKISHVNVELTPSA